MKINSIILENFRNYKNLELDFDESRNIIVGENAQGKTNLIEAIYLTGAAFEGLPEKVHSAGLQAIDSWAAGTVKGGVFYSLSAEARTNKSPRLSGELHVPMYTDGLAVRVSDILGRRYFFSLQN